MFIPRIINKTRIIIYKIYKQDQVFVAVFLSLNLYHIEVCHRRPKSIVIQQL